MLSLNFNYNYELEESKLSISQTNTNTTVVCAGFIYPSHYITFYYIFTSVIFAFRQTA